MSNDSPTSTTAVLAPPDPGLPRPGGYKAVGARCILEISACLGPLATLRGRLAVLENTLVVDDSGERATLSLEADIRSLRTTRPLAGRRLLGRNGLDARHHGLLRLRADRIAIDDDHWRIRGRLTLREAPIDITLQARVAARTEERIAVVATGWVSSRALRGECSVRLPRSVPADRFRLMVAADFR
ncbi:MAG: YceI family protein [Catenulispora sp.]|nr:YceI family protein [Catenulispora sp.]